MSKSDWNVALILKSIKMISNDRHVHLCTGDIRESDKNTYTILTGKNGTGKTSLLSVICECFSCIEWNGKLRKSGARGVFENGNVQISYIDNNQERIMTFDDGIFAGDNSITIGSNTNVISHDGKVISVSCSPFDKLPVEVKVTEKLRVIKKSNLYRYLGQKSSSLYQPGNGNVFKLLELFMENFSIQQKRNQIKNMLEFIGYAPYIEANFKIRFKNLFLIAGDISKIAIINNVKRHSGYAVNQLLNDIEHEGVAEAISDAIRDVSVLISKSPGKITVNIDFADDEYLIDLTSLLNSLHVLRKYGIISFSEVNLFRYLDKNVEKIEIRSVSSGEMSIFIMFLGISCVISDNSVIVIDEPEIGLHPEWQERFIELLMSAFSSYMSCHFIIATHSPQIVSNVDQFRGTIVNMETLEVHDSSRFFERSADFQLANLFGAPGFRNEFLTRISLAVLKEYGKMNYTSDEVKANVAILSRVYPRLSEKDPVFDIVKFILENNRENNDR